ncbi:MAG: peptidylprolyl isomerase [Campylobacterales bacterium]
MISWMQRHKKWLVITVWISAIAFVGAGFVGWGSYDFGKNEGAIAEVGDIEIDQERFNQEYSRLYNMFSNISPDFDQAQAKEMGLPKQALDNLINQAFLENYALDNGVIVAENEVADQIATMEPFFVDGKFNKDRYFDILRQNELNPTQFEKMIKREILVKKISEMLKPALTELEEKAITAPLNIADKIEIDIIEKSDIEVNVDENKLKAYWEERKNQFLTPPAFEIEYVTINYENIDPTEEQIQKHYDEYKLNYKGDDGEILALEDVKSDIVEDVQKDIAETDILRMYIKLKKGELGDTNTTIISSDTNPFGDELIMHLKETSEGETIKFARTNDGVITAKLTNNIDPMPKQFAEVRDEVEQIYIDDKKQEKLEQLANSKLEDFKGKNQGFLRRGDIDKIDGLREYESAEFLNTLFESNKVKDVVYLEEKAVLYKIVEQQLLKDDKDDSSADFLVQSVEELKYKLIEEELLNRLKKEYEVRVYAKFE